MAGGKTIGDYVSLQRGTTYKGNLVGKPGPALLGLGSIRPGGGFRSDYKTYGGECPEKLTLHAGDLFVSLKGATKDSEMIGSIARVPASVSSGRLTQDTVKLVFQEPNHNLTAFLYWLLRTPHYRRYCAGRATGSAVVALSREDFLSYPVPALNAGRACIVKLLEDIESKIELNRRMNETLEAMARAIFKSWFVDFEPVRAKAEGRQPFGMDAETAALFPDSFEDSELGKIPKGWRVQSLDSIADFLNGLALQKYPADGDESLPVIKIAQLRRGGTEGADRASKDVPSEYFVHDGDVLFSWSGSLEAEIWCGGPGALNQHLFKVTSRAYPKWFYFYWVREHLPEFQAIASDKATTMGHIQRHHLTEAKVLVPESPLLAAMDKIMLPVLEALTANKRQSRTIASIRDALLPRLISGEIRAPAAGKFPRRNAI